MEDSKELYIKYCMKCKWCFTCYEDDNSDCTEDDFKKCFEQKTINF
jgi:hypothetical protein